MTARHHWSRGAFAGKLLRDAEAIKIAHGLHPDFERNDFGLYFPTDEESRQTARVLAYGKYLALKEVAREIEK